MNIIIGMAGDCYSAFLQRMFVLQVSPFGMHSLPAILLDALYNVTDLHWIAAGPPNGRNCTFQPSGSGLMNQGFTKIDLRISAELTDFFVLFSAISQV